MARKLVLLAFGETPLNALGLLRPDEDSEAVDSNSPAAAAPPTAAAWASSSLAIDIDRAADRDWRRWNVPVENNFRPILLGILW